MTKSLDLFIQSAYGEYLKKNDLGIRTIPEKSCKVISEIVSLFKHNGLSVRESKEILSVCEDVLIDTKVGEFE